MEALFWVGVAAVAAFGWGWLGHALWLDHQDNKRRDTDSKRYWD